MKDPWQPVSPLESSVVRDTTNRERRPALDPREYSRSVAKTALLALVSSILYLAGRLLPPPGRWLKYLCPTTTVLAFDGGFRSPLRQVVASAFLIAIIHQPLEALAYVLLTGAFGLALSASPLSTRPAHPVLAWMVWFPASLAFYSASFVVWLIAIAPLTGLSAVALVRSFVASRYALLQPLMLLIRDSSRTFLPESNLAASIAVIVVARYGLMLVLNWIALAAIAPILRRPVKSFLRLSLPPSTPPSKNLRAKS